MRTRYVCLPSETYHSNINLNPSLLNPGAPKTVVRQSSSAAYESISTYMKSLCSGVQRTLSISLVFPSDPAKLRAFFEPFFATMSVNASRSEPPRLITIGASHYCEKARWALERAFVSFNEDKHVPGTHIPFTRGLPGGTSCPKLVMGKGPQRVVVASSHEILEFADKKIDVEEDRLYPSDPEQLQLVQSWESKFDDRLGPHVRRYAYCYLLFDPCTYKLLSQGASTTEKVIVWLLLPILRRLIYRGLGCDKPGNRERSLQAVETMFKEVDDALADGRPYICGSKFTAADLTFAALGGPLVAAPQIGSWLPKIDECPAEMVTVMKRFQGTSAGQHILKVYETKRQSPEEKRVY